MTDSMRALIARYLDGTASPEERAEVERGLLDETMAQLLAEELLLQNMLRHAPPERPPAATVARWEAAVLAELASETDDARGEEAAGWFGQAWDVLGWTVRGPAMSLNASGRPSATDGLSTLRYSLAAVPAKAPKPPLWRRLLTRTLRTRGRRD